MSIKSASIKYLFGGFVTSIIVVCVIAATASAKNHPAANRSQADRAHFQSAINLKDPNTRQMSVESFAEGARQAKKAAYKEAYKRGWKVKGKVQGKDFELVSVENGRPVYLITCNVNAAISTGANLLQGFLTGSGLTVGVWDAGDVRSTHQEFQSAGGGSRVRIIDNVGWFSDHSTHVAGTIGAQGIVNTARGMATEVNIDSYDWNSDTSEMLSRAASYPDEPGMIYLSNHSYVQITGWEIGDFNNNGWYDPYWFGVWGEREDRNFGRYGQETANWDLICYSAPYYLPFKAAGNDRMDLAPPDGNDFWYWDENRWVKGTYDPCDPNAPYSDNWDNGGFDTITDSGCAKNVMTIGAVDDANTGSVRDPNKATMMKFSAWGPTDDGRIKPDIVADGNELYSCIATNNTSYDTYSGTSMAAPNASGSAALLVQDYKDFFGEMMRASTLKGLIIHTASDRGNPGPDYKYGWGLMDVKTADDYIRADGNDPSKRRIIEDVLTRGTTNTYKITSDGNSIRATLCWTDPPGHVFTGLDDPNKVLVNDLDLRVIDINDPCDPNSAVTYYPYVLDPNDPNAVADFNDNVLDNVEQVYIAEPNAGNTYRVEVSYKGRLTNGVQYYSLILSEPVATHYIYVNDNGPNDPAPWIPDAAKGGPNSDPCENGSYEHPFDAIQKAIDDGGTKNGDTIIVLDGIYKGIGNYNINLGGKKAIKIKSDKGPDNCIIDCQSKGRAFQFINGETATTLLKGFTIKNGFASDTTPDPIRPWWEPVDANNGNGYGGSIYCKAASSPVIQNCNITDNEADYGGGAIFCDANSNPLITGCNISFNYCGSYRYDMNQVQAGGGIYCRDSSPTIDDCIISENWAEGWGKKGAGGGIACENSDAVIMNCTIYENDCWALYGYYDVRYPLDPNNIQHGGGIYCEGGNPTIWNCTIKRNSANFSGGGIALMDSNSYIGYCEIVDNDCEASGGGIFNIDKTPNSDPCDPNIIFPNCYIRNCLIAENSGYWDGGVTSSYGGSAVIENCTIAKNVVDWPDLTGGLRCYSGYAIVRNSIIWGNVGYQISGIRNPDINDFNEPAVTYSDVQKTDFNGLINPANVWQGKGNMNEDPLFANPKRHDYHLKTVYLNGRYNPQTGLFDSNDTKTSPCINAGDPDSDYSLEPAPNGGRINMGAYGNTWQASKSGEPGPTPGDTGGSTSVDMFDFAVLADNWLLEGEAIKNRKADLNNDDIVDMRDLLILNEYWLWQPAEKPQYYHW